MTVLSIEQIAQLAIDVGIPNGQTLYEAVAIALAESGGDTQAVSPDQDKGVWQINPVHDDKLPGSDRFDPVVNAQLMAMVSNRGSNWSPWVAYNTGAYMTHMARVMGTLQGRQFTPGQPGVGGLTLGSGGGVAPASVDVKASISGIAKFFSILSSADGWVRILKVALGLMLAGLAVIALLATSRTGKNVIAVGTDAAKMALTKGKSEVVS